MDDRFSTVAWIYGLYAEDQPAEIRYIGVSVNPKRRLTQHMWELRTGTRGKYSHKFNWMTSVIGRGSKVSLRLLAQYSSEHEAYSAEEDFISQYRRRGHNLTNAAQGGMGGNTVPMDGLEEFYKSRAESLRTPESRQKRSDALKKSFEDPDRYAAHVEMVRQNGKSPEWRKLVSDGQKKAMETNDFRATADEVRRLPENRELARERSIKQFSSEESRDRAREYAKRRWDATPKEKRVPWNKGSQDSPTKAHWANMSPEEYRQRCMKMSLGSRYNKAKRNGWVFSLTPTDTCKAAK